MKTVLFHLCSLMLLGGFVANAGAQTTAFTYQGRLQDNGHPASGIYDLRFTLYDAASDGNAIGAPRLAWATGMTNGFTVALDFGANSNVFNIWNRLFSGEMLRLDNSALTVRGTFVSSGDRNAKENFTFVDSRAVLKKRLVDIEQRLNTTTSIK